MALSSIDSSRNVDHAYDRYLTAREKLVLKAIPRFEEKLHQSFVKYGRYTIPSFFKPHFISGKQEKLCRSVSDAFLAIVNKLTNFYFTEPVLAHHFHLSRDMEELVRIDPGYSRSIAIMRLDGFLEGEALKFIEINGDAPAGMVYADLLEGIFFEAEELKDFFQEFHCKREERPQKILSALLNVYEEFGGFETPNIAIVDWRTVRTKPEIESLKTFFEEKGYKTTISDPRDLRYKGGKLYHGNFRIDLVYRRLTVGELLDRIEEIQDLVKAYRDRAVCMVNSLRSCIASSKALLSILTNPGYDQFFTEKERELMREHIPWTRRVIDAEKFYGGRTAYLINFLKDEKETLVLKPADGYGGRDVVIGLESTNEEWNQAIDRALKRNWIVQEFIHAPKMTVPTIVNGKLDFLYKKANMGIYIFHDKFAGGVTRLSDETVINLSRGGGLIPIFASEDAINR